jgi:hypothetical protein
MKGDFTRDTFETGNYFSRVLMQQGRVQLDADWNEQTDIFWHYLRLLASDIIGAHGGPRNRLGFKIEVDSTNDDLAIGFGRYYVFGLPCENQVEVDNDGNVSPVTYYNQPFYPVDKEEDPLPTTSYLAYLDVWERHVTYVEELHIREVALGGPDTATRAKVIWQVKLQEIDYAGCPTDEQWDELAGRWQPENKGLLQARARPGDKETDPCITSPEARYRGAENQLYRVEIHTGGAAENGATFKWSRDNGSVIFPILTLKGNEAQLAHLGRDSRHSLQIGDWAEIMYDALVLRGEPGHLLKVIDIDPVAMKVTLEVPDALELPVFEEDSSEHPLLRRWDHKAGDPDAGKPTLMDNGALGIEEDRWLVLEDGVQVQFQGLRDEDQFHEYRSGDYWLIPARTATGDVGWPGPANNPEAVSPHGIQHAYAPLAVVPVSGDPTDCRQQFPSMSKPVSES